MLNSSLPQWAEMALIPGGYFEHLALSWYEDISATPELKKFTSGFLLRQILDNFTKKLQSKLSPDLSLWMSFANDFTIATMLNSLGVFNVCISFSCSMFFIKLLFNLLNLISAS